MNPSIQSVRSSAPNPLLARLGYAAAALITAYVCAEFLLTAYGKYHRLDPATYTMFWDRREWLWTHLLGGTMTIVLGATQFLSQSVFRRPRLHRWAGRVYLLGMLIACAGTTGLVATSPAPLEIRAAFAATALVWITTAVAGVLAIRAGRFAQHRRWMTRNYLVTLAPVTFRTLLGVPGIMDFGSQALMISVLLWLSWVLPLTVCESVFRLRDLRRAV